MKEVERFLTILIKSLGDRIQKHPEVNDWFCYRILGYEGEKFNPWHYDACPNLAPTRPNQRTIYPKKIFDSRVELSVSVRFPKEDNQFIIDLTNNYLRKGAADFEELSEAQWNNVKRYLPPQPLKSASRVDDRRILNGILYVLKTGCSWMEMPRRYGSYMSVNTRLKNWSSEGALDPILNCIESNDLWRERLSKYLATTEDHLPSKRKKTSNGMIVPREEMSSMLLSH